MAEVLKRTAALLRQGLLVIDVSILIVMLLFVYNDYVHYVMTHKSTVVVTTQTSSSSEAKLPLSSYPGDTDGENLMGPANSGSNY